MQEGRQNTGDRRVTYRAAAEIGEIALRSMFDELCQQHGLLIETDTLCSWLCASCRSHKPCYQATHSLLIFSRQLIFIN